MKIIVEIFFKLSKLFFQKTIDSFFTIILGSKVDSLIKRGFFDRFYESIRMLKTLKWKACASCKTIKGTAECRGTWQTRHLVRIFTLTLSPLVNPTICTRHVSFRVSYEYCIARDIDCDDRQTEHAIAVLRKTHGCVSWPSKTGKHRVRVSRGNDRGSSPRVITHRRLRACHHPACGYVILARKWSLTTITPVEFGLTILIDSRVNIAWPEPSRRFEKDLAVRYAWK